MFKLTQSAQSKWRRLNGHQLITLLDFFTATFDDEKAKLELKSKSLAIMNMVPIRLQPAGGV